MKVFVLVVGFFAASLSYASESEQKKCPKDAVWEAKRGICVIEKPIQKKRVIKLNKRETAS